MLNAVGGHSSTLAVLAQAQTETETRGAFLANLISQVLAPLLALKVRLIGGRLWHVSAR